MPDPIAEALSGDWSLETTQPSPDPAEHHSETIWAALVAQGAWRKLTKPQRAALVAIAEAPATLVHPVTRRALVGHKLIDDQGITKAGKAVLFWRPKKEKSDG